MANRRPLFEKTIKQLGGKLKEAENGKVNIIYPESWHSHPIKGKKKR